MSALSGIAQQLHQAQRAQPTVDNHPLIGSILERLSQLESRCEFYEAQLRTQGGQSVMRNPPLAQSVTYTPVSGAQAQEPLRQQVVRSLDSTPIQEGMPSPIPPVVPSSPQTVGSRNVFDAIPLASPGTVAPHNVFEAVPSESDSYVPFIPHPPAGIGPAHFVGPVGTAPGSDRPDSVFDSNVPLQPMHFGRINDPQGSQPYATHRQGASGVARNFCTVCHKDHKYRGVVYMLDTVIGLHGRTPFSSRQLPRFCEICLIGTVIQALSRNGTVNGQLQHSF